MGLSTGLGITASSDTLGIPTLVNPCTHIEKLKYGYFYPETNIMSSGDKQGEAGNQPPAFY